MCMSLLERYISLIKAITSYRTWLAYKRFIVKTYLQKHDRVKYSDHWSTPKEIYDYYIKYLEYYDPCPLKDNDFDFRLIKQNIFLNPPYSDISRWIDWAIYNWSMTNKHVVILIPSRTDTKYFHKLLECGCDLEFIKGRLKFGEQKGSAPFPSVLVHLNVMY